MKILIEIYKLLGKLGIKPKDIIGIGGNIQKMGKSLYNHPISKEALLWIAKNGKLPAKFIDEIKLTARTLKNSKPNEQAKFLENLKQIERSKNPPKKNSAEIVTIKSGKKTLEKPLVASIKEPVTGKLGNPIVDKILSSIEAAKAIADAKKIKNMAIAKGDIKPKITDKKALDAEGVLKRVYNDNNEFASAKGVARNIIMNSEYLSSKQKIDLDKGKDPFLVFEEIYGTKATNKIPNTNSRSVADAYAKHLENITDNRGRGTEDPEFDRETIEIDFNEEDVPLARGGIANHFRKK